MEKNVSKMIENCDFEKRLEFCNLNKSEFDQIKEVKYEYDEVRSYMFAKYVNILSLIPIICSLSIVLNMITFKISFKYKEIQTKMKEVQHKMFEDLKLIAVLNIAYCVLSLLGILSECVQHNGKYCPYFRTNPILQWFDIISILYLRGVVKTCLNIQYLVFAFDRYLSTLCSTDETKFIKNTK